MPTQDEIQFLAKLKAEDPANEMIATGMPPLTCARELAALFEAAPDRAAAAARLAPVVARLQALAHGPKNRAVQALRAVRVRTELERKLCTLGPPWADNFVLEVLHQDEDDDDDSAGFAAQASFCAGVRVAFQAIGDGELTENGRQLFRHLLQQAQASFAPVP